MRSCDAWCGFYNYEDGCIQKLIPMMSFYQVEPYNVIILQYQGDGNFDVQIFNHDNVEIDYPIRPIPLKRPRLTGCVTDIERPKYCKVEVSKLHARFLYNSFSSSTCSYEFVIENQHLHSSNKIEVIYVLQLFVVTYVVIMISESASC